ncbi:MAG: bifunctional lysylphosphatidylglycerol flippase/synthetase MprF [Desulfobacterales bacterium]|nr:bifunctional lysylphosphatidylglycerol flippase/synthetase MprF [Desulfobacterales bacterium]MDD4391294.1 bifunctional lysylphosphatidylglycerol flippase/synthetase MprF [Desulfobacterales bacterium]
MSANNHFTVKRYLGPAFSLCLFGAVAWLLHRELSAYRLEDIFHNLSLIPSFRLWGAVLLTVAGYSAMTGYDALALHYIQHPIGYSKSALASFIGYAFSNNIGFSMIAGASVRYRLYSVWGLSVIEISRVVLFCTVSVWLGFFFLFGVMSVMAPEAVPPSIHLPFASMWWPGFFCLAVVAGYTAVAGIRKKPIAIRGEAIRWPRIGLVPWQAGIGAADWSLAAGVLYLLIPKGSSDISFSLFLGAFLLAQLAGLVSQVPGGLGVFESVFTVLLSPVIPAPQILGGLLAYRMVYYWLPLAVAAVLLGGHELFRGKKKFKHLDVFFGHWISPLIPQIFGLAAFVAGTILLLSGVTPAIDSRIALLKRMLPLSLIELSHFSASVVGMGLLLLGRGLQRRLDAAYVMMLAFLAVGAAGSIAKGLDYEEALALLLIGATLAPCRRYFYRKASLFDGRFSASWVAAVLVVLCGSIWLGYYSYRHVEYADSLWWQFAFSGHASRFLRASLGAVLLALFFAAARLMRPAPPSPEPPTPEEMDRVWGIVQEAGDTYAHLATLGDKYFIFNDDRTAFVMYGISGNTWVAMGDPVGLEGELKDLSWRFREMADRHGDRGVFYHVSHHRLPIYLDMGLSLLKLGEEARVPLSGFSLEGAQRKGFRYTLRKLEKEGCRFEVLSQASVAGRMADLKEISDQWLSGKNSREKGFSLGFFSETYLKRYPVAVAFQNDRMIAFANFWQGAGREELSIDLMRYRPEAPTGIMEYIFLQLMLWAKGEGYRWFNLGMAPLSGFEERGLSPIWTRLGDFVFRHGEHFYNFQGLRQYKEKFDPVWSPKYLACPGGIPVPRILADVSSLISGGYKRILTR